MKSITGHLLLFVMTALGTVSFVGCSSTPAGEGQTQTDGGNTTDGGAKPSFKELSADGYTTVSDVTIHNKVPADIDEIKKLMAESKVDWKKVQVMYEKGKHSVKSDGSIRTLNGFASSPGNFSKYSPDAVAYFKDKGICQLSPVDGFKCTEGKFVDEFIESYAINGTGPFKGASDAQRAAAVKAGLLVLMSYWVRLEFGKALAKVKDGNLEPLKGAPHNWDEAMAFYWGPEGKHSLYEAADNLSKKYNLSESVNKAFFKALVDGLKEMTEKKAAPTAATAAGTKQLHRLFLLGALDAAKQIDEAKDADAKDAARWRGFGYWLGVGDIVAKADGDAAKAFQDVFYTKKTDKDTFKAIQEAIKKSLSGMGMKAEDFGDALK